jgi:hypothetical protein
MCFGGDTVWVESGFLRYASHDEAVSNSGRNDRVGLLERERQLQGQKQIPFGDDKQERQLQKQEQGQRQRQGQNTTRVLEGAC